MPIGEEMAFRKREQCTEFCRYDHCVERYNFSLGEDRDMNIYSTDAYLTGICTNARSNE